MNKLRDLYWTPSGKRKEVNPIMRSVYAREGLTYMDENPQEQFWMCESGDMFVFILRTEDGLTVWDTKVERKGGG